MSNAQYAYNYYLRHGYSPAAAGGIAGNLMVESGFAPDVISGKRRGDSGSAAYAPQLRGERLANYYNYAKAQGVDPSNLDAQLGFVDYEMRTGQDAGAARAYKALQTAQNPADAAHAFMANYERPNNDPNVNAIARRASYAQQLAGGAPLSAEQMAAYQQQGIASLAETGGQAIDGAKAALPTLGAVETPDEDTGLASIFAAMAKEQQKPAPQAAPVQMTRGPVDTRSYEEKMASVSQTPEAYMKQLAMRRA